MPRRVNAGLYREDEGSDVELAVKATGNGGVESAQFHHDSTVLNHDIVDGFPRYGALQSGGGTHQFRALLAFRFACFDASTCSSS